MGNDGDFAGQGKSAECGRRGRGRPGFMKWVDVIRVQDDGLTPSLLLRQDLWSCGDKSRQAETVRAGYSAGLTLTVDGYTQMVSGEDGEIATREDPQRLRSVLPM